MSSTISLIGMPGAGKSTVGVLLAKRAGLGFVDTDLEIQYAEGASLQDILERRGYQYLREVEATTLGAVSLDSRVVATGGSVVYSPSSMQRLAAAGPVVYLQLDLPALESRIASQPQRGIASPADQSLADIYLERTPLYERYADITVVADGNPDQLVEQIWAKVS